MPSETHLLLTGLTCGACVRRVDQKLRAVPGVVDVRIDLASGRATITRVDEARVDPATAEAALIASVERAGYGAVLAPGPAA